MILNLIIFLVTLVLVLRLFWKDGHWSPAYARSAFRFFTVQSNAFCAAAALLMCLAPQSPGAWLFKYVGTAAVTVTMLTVFLFLGPSIGSLKPLLSGSDIFMHLLTPLMAIVSFSVYEKRGMAFDTALIGMLPMIVYGIWYLYKVVCAPPDKRWEDFYGFNKGGRWPVSFAGMMLGGFVVCMGLMALQNL